jgi:hypothetical protein
MQVNYSLFSTRHIRTRVQFHIHREFKGITQLTKSFTKFLFTCLTAEYELLKSQLRPKPKRRKTSSKNTKRYKQTKLKPLMSVPNMEVKSHYTQVLQELQTHVGDTASDTLQNIQMDRYYQHEIYDMMESIEDDTQSENESDIHDSIPDTTSLVSIPN